MLCVRIKKDESVDFTLPDGRFMTVKVEHVGPYSKLVHLAIDAPRDIKVLRSTAKVKS